MGMSGDYFAPRFDVVAETRRRWSREEKLAIVKEASGACVNVSAVARRHGLKPALLYRWRKEFGAAEQPVRALVPVVVDEAPCKAEFEPASPAAQREVEITLANGRTVKVPVGLDAATLRRLVSTVDD